MSQIELITEEWIKNRNRMVSSSQYPKAKFHTFCEIMYKMGYKVELYNSQSTVSKYVKVTYNKKTFKVRFSNHQAAQYAKESAKLKCDFYVGQDSEGTWHNMEDAIATTIKFFNKK